MTTTHLLILTLGVLAAIWFANRRPRAPRSRSPVDQGAGANSDVSASQEESDSGLDVHHTDGLDGGVGSDSSGVDGGGGDGGGGDGGGGGE